MKHLNFNDFKSLKYEAKLLGNTVAYGSNGILRNTTIAVPLKYPSNYCRSLKMPLINCKVKLKLKWTNHCVFLWLVLIMTMLILIISSFHFTIKDAKLYIPVVTLSVKDNQGL